MARFDPQFIDEPKAREPYEGCLVVFNIGEHNWHKIGMSKHFEETLTKAVADAHASGWLVQYVFDLGTELSPPPDFLDSAPEQDLTGISGKLLGMDFLDFSLVPSQRREQFKRIVERVSSQAGVKLLGSSVVVTGWCKIGGDEVFLPPTRVK